LRGIEFSKTPCATCRLSEPPRFVKLKDGKTAPIISYTSQFENPSVTTWRILAGDTYRDPLEGVTYQYIRYLRMDKARRGKIRIFLWGRKHGRLLDMIKQFTQTQENVLSEIALNNWNFTQSQIADACDVSRQRISKILNTIAMNNPQLQKILIGAN